MSKYKYFCVAFIMILFMCTILGYYSESIITDEIVYITPLDHSVSHDLLRISDINKVKNEYPKGWISYQYEMTSALNNGNRNCKVNLTITNEYYKRWNNLKIKEGCFFTELGDSKHQILMDEAVAFKLFGNFEVVEEEVALDNQRKNIKGILKQSNLSRWRHKKMNSMGDVYITGDADEKYAELPLNGIVVGGLSGNPLEDSQIVNQIFTLLGKEKKAYAVISLKKYSLQVKKYAQILIGSMVLTIMVIAAKLLLKKAKDVAGRIKEGLKFYYLNEYIKLNKWYLLKNICLLSAVLLIGGVVSCYFIKEILGIVVESKVNIGYAQGLPGTIKILRMINQIGVVLLSLGELIVGAFLFRISRQH